MPRAVETHGARPGYRLCVVTDSREVGGAEIFLRNLVAALPDDVQVTLLGTTAGVVERVTAGRTGATGHVVEGGIADFRRALGRAAPDVVHLNLTSFTSCRRATLACVSRRLPFVLVDHLPTPGLTWRGRALQRLLTRLSATRIAVGTAAARDTERYGGLGRGTVEVIPNGVPRPGCRRQDLTGSPLVLGALARLERQKGIDVLLRALPSVPDCLLLVAGDGSQRGVLQELAAELGVGARVRFLGAVGSPCEVLDRVHALVLPSRWEAMPLAVLEAMHCGLPVVATDVGSLREVVLDGETGIVVPADSPSALAEACRRLGSDSGLRARMGTAARERAETEFSVSAMAARYDGRYRAVLDHR